MIAFATQVSSTPLRLLFGVAFASTAFCLAINAYTLQIGYPLWKFVRPEDFAALHQAYLKHLNWGITVPHIVMFFSCGALVFWRPGWMDPSIALAVCLLTWTVVAVSAFLAGPVHDRFARQGHMDDGGFTRLLWISHLRQWMALAATLLLLQQMMLGLR